MQAGETPAIPVRSLSAAKHGLLSDGTFVNGAFKVGGEYGLAGRDNVDRIEAV